MFKQWKKGLAAVTGSLTLAVALVGPGVAPAYADEAAAKNTYRIVTLGDSLTVGYEPGMDLNSKPYGFVDRLYEQGLFHGRTEVTNLGIGGLKTDGLNNYVKAVLDERAITPEELQPGLSSIDPRTKQIGADAAKAKPIIAEADLITITIGGNDMMSLVSTVETLSDEQLQAKMQELFQIYKDNVSSVITGLHSLNPDAAIVVADQYNPVPKIADEVAYAKLLAASGEFTKLVDGVAGGFATQGVDIKVAHVAKKFVGSELTMTHILKDDIHPNQYGYETMAGVFAETIWGSYQKPPVQNEGQPMRIVVKGQELNTPYKPILRDNLNYVAIQDIVNVVGATTKWENKTSSATITFGDQTVVVKIGAKTVQVNGTTVPIDTPAFLHKVGKEDKTYVPLAVIASGLGFDVQYSSKLRTAFINL
ncbi:stalk domain-containing protein [Paenibacillus sp. HGF5]|uniref:stalk domain-containing protein n=1 Tax=Paenibacillus sp. HGF5 TaxID=908341 RepID=UPI0002071B5B|nr:stalk domain-containing protein [Paenibacillus sp. HGF5]EGG36903.1 copper amine oxidase N-terminal domain protein [Paenibacillus sp. HGF5]